MEENTSDEKPEQPTYDLIQKIKDGQLNLNNLDKESKIRCVKLLLDGGQTVPQIAQFLKRSDRQIQRYKEVIQKRNARIFSSTFSAQFAGDTVAKEEFSHNFLVRLLMSKEVKIADKIKAIAVALQYRIELGKWLQSMGYLPSQPQKIVGDLFHHKGKPVPPPEIKILPVATKPKKDVENG